MKNIIGTLIIYPPKRICLRTLDGYMGRDLVKKLGKEIVIDIEKMFIRKPFLNDSHVKSTKFGTFSFTPKDGNIEDYIGTYNVIQKDEDTFKLKKIKHA